MWKWLTSGSNALLRQNAVSGGGCGSRRFSAAVGWGGGGAEPQTEAAVAGETQAGGGEPGACPPPEQHRAPQPHTPPDARAHLTQGTGTLPAEARLLCTWAYGALRPGSGQASDSPSRLPWPTGLRSSWVWPPPARRRASFSCFSVWSSGAVRFPWASRSLLVTVAPAPALCSRRRRSAGVWGVSWETGPPSPEGSARSQLEDSDGSSWISAPPLLLLNTVPCSDEPPF